MKSKFHFCPNCGESLGSYFQPYPYLDTCGAVECEREVRHGLEVERNEARERAEEDDYSRYY